MRPWLFLFPFSLGGCFFISADDQDDREAQIDADGDGLTAAEDCDDRNAGVGLGAWFADQDKDGFGDEDAAATVGCGAPEGFVADATDCDDAQAAVHPEAVEICDAAQTDEDCDGAADDADSGAAGQVPWYADGDADGFGTGSPLTTACDAPTNTVSNATDCDDTRTGVNPAATETCNLLDDDCDGGADDLDPQGATGQDEQWVDADGDGFGDDAIPAVTSCAAIADGVLVGGDCDDDYASINPDAIEVCDASDADEDCNGDADDADLEVQGQIDSWVDADRDGFGAFNSLTTTSCDLPAGSVTDATDCDDAISAINPGASEACDPADVDEDCDGTADNADPGAVGEVLWYADVDGDRWGAGTGRLACDAPFLGSVTRPGDCDDQRADVSLDDPELCDALNADEDCDGAADDLDTAATGKVQRWPDFDTDGYGDRTASPTSYCDPPSTVVDDATDCHDKAATVHPGGTEVCRTGLDEDCDGGPNQCVAPAQLDLSSTPPSFVGKNVNAGNTDATGGFDFNGDGKTDLAIGSFQDTTNSTNSGAVYVFLGPNSSTSLGTQDVVISSRKSSPAFPADWDYTGTSVAPGGDMNADGRDELILAGWNGNLRQGLVWVIAGRAAPAPIIDTEVEARLELTSSGPAYTELGSSIVGGGYDLTDDGKADFVVGTRGGLSAEDSVLWLVDGTLSGKHAIEELGLPVTRIHTSAPLDWIGLGSSIGDLDGDGIGDLAVGGPHYANGVGRVWVVLGPIATGTDLLLGASSNTTADFVLNKGGTVTNDRFGYRTTVVDVNGDGLDDLVTSSGYDRPDVGITWHPGVLHTFLSPLALSETTATADFRVVGFSNPNAGNFESLGARLSNGGDFDGDGLGDVIAGAPWVEYPLATGPFDGANHGAAVKLSGDALTTNGSTIRLDDHLTTPFAGVTVVTAGAASRQFGERVRDAGDADGDGYDDLLVTEVYRPNGATGNAGATWLLFSTGM